MMKAHKWIPVWSTGLCLLAAACVEEVSDVGVESLPPSVSAEAPAPAIPAPPIPAPSVPAPPAADPGAAAVASKVPAAGVVAAVSCVDAVGVPGGQASKFRISGLIAKMPTSRVQVESETAPIGVDPSGRSSGPGRMTAHGHLSREQITKVVNANLLAIQSCYERSLLKQPGLSGKVVMEWTISTSGRVAVVRTKQNTMKNQAVPMCISARIKRWKFPRPKGGKVVVSYPFIFKSPCLDRPEPKPKSLFKAPERLIRIRGDLDRDAVAKVVHKNTRQVQVCYEKSQLLEPALAGKVVMEWTVSAAGTVTAVEIKQDTLSRPEVARCISAKIKGWRFPKPVSGIAVVSYPFIFRGRGF